MRTRIPNSLRTAAVSAVEQGADRLEVQKACGVSSVQFSSWEREQEKFSSEDVSSRKNRSVARVFAVHSEPEVQGGGSEEPPLEFVVNGWSITLRRTEKANG